jgi:hypothetical protein
MYPEYLDEALGAGADLFLGKAERPEHLLAALTTIAKDLAQPLH